MYSVQRCFQAHAWVISLRADKASYLTVVVAGVESADIRGDLFLLAGGGEGLSSRNEEKAPGLVGCFHIRIGLREE